MSIAVKLFPCHPKNENSRCFRGKINILENNKICNKCEFMNSYAHFINREYKDYALEKCCDVDMPGQCQPEAILVNRNNSSDKIVIEVKSLHKLLDGYINKNENATIDLTYFFKMWRYDDNIKFDYIYSSHSIEVEITMYIIEEKISALYIYILHKKKDLDFISFFVSIKIDIHTSTDNQENSFVYRDELMIQYNNVYQNYGFDKNVGYGTKEHVISIEKYGIVPIHRKSFLKNIIGAENNI